MQFTLAVHRVRKVPAKALVWLFGLVLSNPLNFQVLDFVFGKDVGPTAVVKCLVYVVVDELPVIKHHPHYLVLFA